MSKKSSMSVHIAATDSRTRTKQSAIRTPSIFEGIPGAAQHFLALQQPFTILRTDQMKQTLVDIVVRISHDLGSHLGQLLRRIRTGRFALDICRRCTSLENATMQRSSSERIISDSI